MLKKRLLNYTKSTPITEFLFYFALAIYYSALMLYTTDLYMIPKYAISKILCVIVLGVLAIRAFLLPTINRQMMAIYIPITLLAFISDVQAGRYVFIPTLVAIIFASTRYSLKSVLKFSLLVLVTLVSLVFLLVVIGIIPLRFHYRSGMTIRYNLGFSYPTLSTHLILAIFLLIGYLFDKYLKIIHFIIGALIAGAIFYLTDTRVVFVQTIAFLVIMWWYKFDSNRVKRSNRRVQRRPLLSNIGIYLPVWSTVVYIVLTYLRNMNIPVVNQLDGLLSGRLRNTFYAFSEFSQTLFGQKMPFETGFINGVRVTNYFYIDSSFIQRLFTHGIVFFVVMMTLCVFMLKKAYHTDKKMFIVLLFVMIHSIFDPQLMELHFTPFWFFVLPHPESKIRGESYER